MPGSITDVAGVLLGHEHDFARGSGVTVLRFPQGAAGAADIRGEAAGTRQMDSLLRPHPVRRMHALVLAGGAAFWRGAAAAARAPPRPRARGSVGAGAGATVGKAFGIGRAMKGGFGTASEAGGGTIVGACAVVTAFGDVVDPETGDWIAGAREEDGKGPAWPEKRFPGGFRRGAPGPETN